MAKVTMANGDTGATTEDMYLHGYSGKPLSQYEFVGDPEASIGDTFAIAITAELTGVNIEKIKDGTRHVLKLRVLESAPLQLVRKASEAHVDPNQIPMDEALGDYDPDETGE